MSLDENLLPVENIFNKPNLDIIIHNILSNNNKLQVSIKQISTDSHYDFINPYIYNILCNTDFVNIKCNYKIIDLLPDNIKTIYIDYNIFTEFYKITKYPSELYKLIICPDWSEEINNLPNSLKYLEFKYRISKPNISISNLPSSLTYLIISKLRQDIIFPPLLKYLELKTYSYNDLENLPSTLETLKIDITLNTYEIYESFSNILNCFPDNINYLSLNIKILSYNMEEIRKINKNIRIYKLPNNLESLKVLCVPEYFENCVLPDNLNSIILEKNANFGEQTIDDCISIFKNIKPSININII